MRTTPAAQPGLAKSLACCADREERPAFGPKEGVSADIRDRAQDYAIVDDYLDGLPRSAMRRVGVCDMSLAPSSVRRQAAGDAPTTRLNSRPK
jgi:hypothetical protein